MPAPVGRRRCRRCRHCLPLPPMMKCPMAQRGPGWWWRATCAPHAGKTMTAAAWRSGSGPVVALRVLWLGPPAAPMQMHCALRPGTTSALDAHRRPPSVRRRPATSCPTPVRFARDRRRRGRGRHRVNAPCTNAKAHCGKGREVGRQEEGARQGPLSDHLGCRSNGAAPAWQDQWVTPTRPEGRAGDSAALLVAQHRRLGDGRRA